MRYGRLFHCVFEWDQSTGFSCERVEIGWLTTRLANLSLSDEDFDQTQDYIFELRQERESLKRCFNV
jgi:hypothetical protein